MTSLGDGDAPPELINTVTDEATRLSPVEKKVPISIITGYLGAGKSTLLNYILTAEHNKKIAVILNGWYTPSLSPFFKLYSHKQLWIIQNCGPNHIAEVKDLRLTGRRDGVEATEWIPLANGCICCSVKDSGVAALESLVERQSEKSFDYILLETTGVADPGNIAPMFWMDEGLNSSIYLDGIVTVVDVKNILRSLDEPTTEELPEEVKQEQTDEHDHMHRGPLMSTAHLQISHADVIILNKIDLVSPSELDTIRSRILSINSLARIIPTSQSRVADLSGTVLDLEAYTSFPTTIPDAAAPDFSSKGHSHLDPTISTIDIPVPAINEVDVDTVETYLQDILWPTGEQRPYDIHRTKGLIRVKDGHDRVIQGVREIFEILTIPSRSNQESGDVNTGRIVYIGRGLDHVPRELGLTG